MSFRQEAGEDEGSVCKLVDIYCSATNRFLHLLSYLAQQLRAKS